MLDMCAQNFNMYPREYSMAWLILASAPTIAEGAQLLADAINESRANGQGIDGVPLEIHENGFPTVDSINNGATAFQDTKTDSVIVSPSIINGLVQDIDYIVNQVLAEHSSVVSDNHDGISDDARFNYSSPHLSDIQIGLYGTVADICNNAVNTGGGYCIFSDSITSSSVRTYSLYTWDGTCELSRIKLICCIGQHGKAKRVFRCYAKQIFHF